MKKPVKKYKPLFKIIMADVYESGLIVSINQTDAQLAKSLQTLDGINAKEVLSLYENLLQGDTQHVGRTTWNKIKNCIAIRIYSYTNCAEDHATIAHEVFHAIHKMLDAKGLYLSDDSEEAYAYLMSHFTKHIYKDLLK